MAVNTWLQMVNTNEIVNLKASPDCVIDLNKREQESYSTYYRCCIYYFLLGNAYPDKSIRWLHSSMGT